MTTRADVRTAVRLRLEDAGAAPLWEDALLNEAIAEAIRRYGQIVPKEAAVSAVAVSGAVRVAFAAGVVDPARIVRVRDPSGAVIGRWREEDRPEDRAQGWRWWSDGLDLAMPAAAGAWTVEHRAGRVPPGDDVAAADVLPGDEPGVILLAVAAALDRRAIEEGKRGATPMAASMAALAESARREGERALRRRRARAPGG
ncbi:MAG: hypothetical protein ACR2J8_09915 [Thermomicrobiales bacterium]